MAQSAPAIFFIYSILFFQPHYVPAMSTQHRSKYTIFHSGSSRMYRFYCIRRQLRILRLQIIMSQHEMFFYLVTLKLA